MKDGDGPLVGASLLAKRTNMPRTVGQHAVCLLCYIIENHCIGRFTASRCTSGHLRQATKQRASCPACRLPGQGVEASGVMCVPDTGPPPNMRPRQLSTRQSCRKWSDVISGETCVSVSQPLPGRSRDRACRRQFGLRLPECRQSSHFTRRRVNACSYADATLLDSRKIRCYRGRLSPQP